MNYRSRWQALALLVLALACVNATAEVPQSVSDRLRNGDVLLLRHAIAPGFGDPDNFRPGDCSTQRNLSDEGREQARAIGNWLKAHGINRAAVYSSQWCRCLETAELLDLGEVQPLPALNSFFQRPEDRAGNLAALRRFLADWRPSDMPLVLVTHQVTVTAMTGIFPGSGEGVVARLADNGELREFTRQVFDQ